MTKIAVKKTGDSLSLKNDLFKVVFTAASGGFPAEISVAGSGACRAADGRPLMSAVLDGKLVAPSLSGAFAPRVAEDDEMVAVAFDNVRWMDKDGGEAAEFRLDLQYEIHADGAAFVKTFFFSESLERRELRDFKFAVPVSFDKGVGVNWAHWKYPDAVDATIIQDLNNFKRNIPMGEDKRADGGFFPFVSFDFGEGPLRDGHIEFFFESWNSLTPDYRNTSSSVAWAESSVTAEWTFQKEPRMTEKRAWQWRNTWGWCARKFPVDRKRPPLRVFHHLDNFDRHPSDAMVEQAADEGANVFIMHENWRQDYKQGEFAHDEARLKSFVDACHKKDMRVMLYVRGNEDAMRLDFGRHLVPGRLKRNHDGIYMDYCAAAAFLTKDEYSPGGRICFREFDMLMRRLRETVGPDGLLIGHSGPFFSAVGFTQLDAYLGGEQEKGELIKSRTLHAYFSGLSVAQTCLWTAAFPVYRTRRMFPFLVPSLQFPFLHLGAQLKSCSLEHPTTPSLITFARPLWRMWEVLEGRGGLRVFSTQNRPGLFNADSEDTGACSMTDSEGNTLLIVTNYLETPRRVRVAPDLKALGMGGGMSQLKLHAGYEGCSWTEAKADSVLEADLDGFGLAAFLFVRDVGEWKAALDRFTRPYPSRPKEEKAHRDMLESLRKRRFEPKTWEDAYINVSIDNYPNSYEDSLIVDLFDNVVELHDVSGDKPRILGHVTNAGLKKTPPEKGEKLVNGDHSGWISLREALGGGGRAKLALWTKRGEFEFYSFVRARISDKPGETASTYEIEYNNDIDMDWSRLDFEVDLKK